MNARPTRSCESGRPVPGMIDGRTRMAKSSTISGKFPDVVLGLGWRRGRGPVRVEPGASRGICRKRGRREVDQAGLNQLAYKGSKANNIIDLGDDGAHAYMPMLVKDDRDPDPNAATR